MDIMATVCYKVDMMTTSTADVSYFPRRRNPGWDALVGSLTDLGLQSHVAGRNISGCVAVTAQ